MTLVIKKPTGSKLVMRKGWQPMDPDAATYIAAVEAADGQALEEKTKIAIDNFVLGCKADGIWSAIKASCILAGARTLSGALVPLVGAAPTNSGLVSYNRKSGVTGTGVSSNFLNTNRANNSDPQNSKHAATYATSVTSSGAYRYVIGTSYTTSGWTFIGEEAGLSTSNNLYFTVNSSVGGITVNNSNTAGLIGASRGSAASISIRTGNITTSISSPSEAPSSNSILMIRNTTSTFAFYSIGESLNLALLDARVGTLINAFAAAIP